MNSPLARYLHAVPLEVGLYLTVGFERAVNIDLILVVHEHFVHFEIDKVEFKLVEVDILLVRGLEDGLVDKHETYASARSKRTSHLVEITPDIG